MSFDATPFDFTAEFNENVALYRGVIRVWLEEEGEDAGKLKAEYRTGEIQELGHASDYIYAVAHGYTGTVEEWVDTLVNSTINAQAAYNYKNESAQYAQNSLNSSKDSESWANGKRSGVDVESTDPAYHNNSKYYLELTAEEIASFNQALTGAVTTYQTSTDGSNHPTGGTWTSTPTPEKGKYVWAKTTYTWNENTVETYAVAYQGLDGEGKVSSVNNKLGDVVLYSTDINVSASDNRTILNAMTDIIDDTSGAGDTDKTWSADKISSSFGSIRTDVGSAIDALQEELDDAVSTLQAEIESNKTFSVALDTVTNVSGSYSHSTTIQGVTSTMKPIAIEYGDPSVFRNRVTIEADTDEVTLSCDDVVGTSAVTVILMEEQQTEVIPDGNEDV